MANMSHCRFENTVADLRDCEDALDGNVDYDDEKIAGLSDRELKCASELVTVAKRVATFEAAIEEEIERRELTKRPVALAASATTPTKKAKVRR